MSDSNKQGSPAMKWLFTFNTDDEIDFIHDSGFSSNLKGLVYQLEKGANGNRHYQVRF